MTESQLCRAAIRLSSAVNSPPEAILCSPRGFPAVMEIQPVVLAGGRGRKLYPFTEDTPKALLPVANRPLLYYPLLYLQNEGFTGT